VKNLKPVVPPAEDRGEVQGDTPHRLEAGRKLLEDESSFIDFKRSYIFLTEEHTIFGYTT
jgi:hypothetical protein